MSSLNDIRPGDLMFTTISGIGGKAIALAEKVNDPIVDWEVARKVQHVGVVVTTAAPEWSSNPLGPRLVQAMPGGAEMIELTSRQWSPAFIYVRPAWNPFHMAQDLDVACAAEEYIGVPYSWLDYAAIAGRHVLALKPSTRTPFDRYVSSTKHMICSQLADQALCDAGFHVFDDGRIPQDVTPAALYCALLAMPGTQICSSAFEWCPVG